MLAVPSHGETASHGVITCSDRRMLPAACCALLSAKRHVGLTSVRFFLLAIDIDDNAREQIKIFTRHHGFDIEVVDFVSPSFEGQGLGRWPASAVARLYMDEQLPSDIDRLLYLDADTLVVSALDALFDIDLKGQPLAAVDDFLMAFPRNMGVRIAQIGMAPESRYFNSGVLLIDWAGLKRRNFLKDARALFFRDSNRYDCPDQDALNVVTERNWLPLDPKWNAQTGILAFVPKPAILHFTGPKKPWHSRVQFMHRDAHRFYKTELAGTAWAGFCATPSIFANIRSLLSHHLINVTKQRKHRITQRYFEAQQTPRGT
jgi:lipopolysaccharide biosynthesis glycosyltransferase